MKKLQVHVTTPPQLTAELQRNRALSVELGARIATLPDSFEEASVSEVNFRDWAGRVVAGYTVAQARALTELPTAPDRDGLVFQGWNWTLDEVNALTRPMEIGGHYITDDGATRIYIEVPPGDPALYSFTMNITVSEGSVRIDWGDGAVQTAQPGTVQFQHIYAGPGSYVIRIVPADDSVYRLGTNLWPLFGTMSARDFRWHNMVRRVELGAGMREIGKRSFQNMRSMESVNVPREILSFGGQAFNNTLRLRYLVIPRGCTIDATAFRPTSGWEDKPGLYTVSLPPDYAGENYLFPRSWAMARVTLPDSVTTLGGFKNCYCLADIVIPAGVASIPAECFYNCVSMDTIRFLSATPPALADGDTFYQLRSGVRIIVPRGSLSAYRSAANWRNYADIMEEAEE